MRDVRRAWRVSSRAPRAPSPPSRAAAPVSLCRGAAAPPRTGARCSSCTPRRCDFASSRAKPWTSPSSSPCAPPHPPPPPPVSSCSGAARGAPSSARRWSGAYRTPLQTYPPLETPPRTVSGLHRRPRRGQALQLAPSRRESPSRRRARLLHLAQPSRLPLRALFTAFPGTAAENESLRGTLPRRDRGLLERAKASLAIFLGLLLSAVDAEGRSPRRAFLGALGEGGGVPESAGPAEHALVVAELEVRVAVELLVAIVIERGTRSGRDGRLRRLRRADAGRDDLSLSSFARALAFRVDVMAGLAVAGRPRRAARARRRALSRA